MPCTNLRCRKANTMSGGMDAHRRRGHQDRFEGDLPDEQRLELQGERNDHVLTRVRRQDLRHDLIEAEHQDRQLVVDGLLVRRPEVDARSK